MKKAVFRLFSVLLAIFLVSSLAHVATAADESSVTKNGIEATLTTDKDVYATGDVIDAEVAVKNNSGTVAKISVAITVPEGLTLLGKANYTATLQNGKTHAGSAPTTGDGTHMIPAVVLAVVALCALVALAMLGKANNRAFMSMVLAVAIVASLGVMAVPAQASADTIVLTRSIKLDGKDTNVTATVDFALGVLFEDDFSDLTGWNELPAKGIPDGATVGIKDGMLSITVPTTVNALVAKTHALNYTGKITFEVDMAVTFPDGAAANKAGGAVIVYTDDNQPAICFYLMNGKMGYFDVDKTTGQTVNKFTDYVSGTTCRLKLVADTETDTYDIYIGGKLAVSGVKFRTNGDNLTMIQLGSGGNDVGATVTFDNLKVSVTGEPEDSATALPFEEDFTDLEGWEDLPVKGTPDGATVGVQDGMLSITVPTTVNALVAKTHELNCTGKITFEVDMAVTFPEGAAANKAGGAVIVYTDDNKPAICFYLMNGKMGYFDVDKTTGEAVNKFAGYVSGTTCRLKLVADTETDTYDIYINGKLAVSGVKFRTNGDNFTMIQLGSGGNDVGATVAFDNLKIAVTGDLTEEPTEDPTEEPSEEPTEDPTEGPTEESTQPTDAIVLPEIEFGTP